VGLVVDPLALSDVGQVSLVTFRMAEKVRSLMVDLEGVVRI